MRRLVFAALFVSACGGQAEELNSTSEALRASWDFRIKRNKHRANRGGPKKLKIGRKSRRVRYRVKFASNTRYTTRSASNQGDWNKLVGITTNRIHNNSIRLGWRWSPERGQIDLGFYGYARGTRISERLMSVDRNRWTDVELRLHPNGMSVRAGSAFKEVNRNLKFNRVTSTWGLVTAYFGGDEKAPHEMDIQVRDLRID